MNISSSSFLTMKLLSYLLLIVLQLSQCDASPPTLFLQCSNPETNNDTSSNNEIIHNVTTTIAHVRDTVFLAYDPPQYVSAYTTDDCIQLNNESFVKFNENLFLGGGWYQLREEDVNKTFTFVCHDTNSEVGCETFGPKLIVQVQPALTSSDTSTGYEHPRPVTTRLRSKPSYNPYKEEFDYGLIFFFFVGIIGVIALILNCCMEIHEWVKKADEDRMANEMMNMEYP